MRCSGNLRRTVMALGLLSIILGSATTVAAEGEDKKLNLNMDLGFSTMYMFRGWNLFQESSQYDTHMMLAPGLTWGVFDTGISVTLWQAYQLNGNVSDNIDAGFGAEWDLIVSYERSLMEDLTLTGNLVLYMYPFAEEEQAGTSFPVYLEPNVGLTYSWFGFDFSLTLAYFLGLQDAIRDLSYFYINPTVSRSLEVSSTVKLEAAFGFGAKIPNNGDVVSQNRYDLLLAVGLPIQLTGRMYLKPVLNLAWTDVTNEGLGHEVFLWGGMNIGADF